MSKATRLIERLDVTCEAWTPRSNPEHDKWTAKTTSPQAREQQQTHQGNIRWTGQEKEETPTPPKPTTAWGPTRGGKPISKQSKPPTQLNSTKKPLRFQE